jgi:predicted permease
VILLNRLNAFLHRLASVAAWIVRRRREEARLDDEMQTFVEMSAAEKMRDGASADVARRMARMELGGVEQAKERVRSDRHGAGLDEAGRDVRYALRMFARNPGFTFVVLLTLALGVGANTAIFSLIDALMLRSLPVSKPAELVQLNLRARNDAFFGGESLSYAMIRALDAQQSVFSGVAGFSGLNVNVGDAGSVRQVHGALVTGSYYQTLGLAPVAGRLLNSGDDEPGAPLSAVISYGYWEREYARSASAVGQTIRGNGLPITIVGVSPRGFVGADAASVADITMTVATLPRLNPNAAPLLGKGTFFLRALARPAPGLSASAAAARLNVIWPGLSADVISPKWDAARRKEMAESLFVFEPGATGWSGLRAVYKQPLYVLMAVAGVVLLIACANVASLFLARASSRQREIAVRLAIGAGRRRIVRQLVTEGLLLSFAGAVLGVGVAAVAGRFLVDLISTGPFRVEFDLTPNWHVLAFSAALAIATGVVFGLAPAFSAGRTAPRAALAAVLKNDARSGAGRSRLLSSLVVMQVALSLVLVAGAGLFARTLRNLERVDPGFSGDNVLIVGGDLRSGGLAQKFFDDVRRVPGVEMATFATHTPLDGSAWTEPIVPAAQPVPRDDNARVIAAGPEFFDALTIKIRRGRSFTDRDARGNVPVAIVSQRYADREFPHRDPIGQLLKGTLMGKAATMEIVGVAADVQFGGLRSLPPATVYMPFAQFEGDLAPSLIVRARGNVSEVRERIRTALQPLVPEAPLQVVVLSGQVSATIVQDRMMATLAGGFGALALILCSVGLYGLLAYSVARRSREIGIRMALGARASGVVGMVIGNGTRLVAMGFALGLPAAWLASKSVATMLFGLKPGDPLVLGGAMVLLFAAALVACYLPARRAARVDPLTALRQD